MDARAIFDRAVATCGDAVFDFQDSVPNEVKEGPRDPCFRARPERIVDVMRDFRDAPELRFDFLQNLTAVDWIKRDVMEIVYHLFSYPHRHAACVKVEVPRAAPRLPSVATIWPTANWLEREQFDLLGVVFEGHPDLRRILMPDDWVGHPMRKDFHEPKSYRGMPTSRPSPMELLVTYDRAHVDAAAAGIAAKAATATATATTTAPAPAPPPATATATAAVPTEAPPPGKAPTPGDAS